MSEVKTKKSEGGSSKLKAQGLDRLRIDPKMPMSELVEKYPELIEVLTYDYGLHCVNCMISDFDTLEEGSVIHGIEGEDFENMIKDLEDIINNPDED